MPFKNMLYSHYMVISVKSGLKSRPTFAHLHMQLDKAALYLAVGRSRNIKSTPSKLGVFYVGSLCKYAHGVPARRPDAQRAAFCVAKNTEWGRSYTLKRQK